MAKNTENKATEAPSVPSSETKPEVPTPSNFPCSVQEYCISKGLNPFLTKVFVKSMEMEPGVGKYAKYLVDEWDARREEFYKRPAT